MRTLTLAAALSCLAACGAEVEVDDARPESGTPGGREVVRETLVVVQPLRVGPVRDEVVVSAKVDSRARVAVFPKLSNLPVLSVAVEAGDLVERGAQLASLFDKDLRLAAQTAEAALSEARHTLGRREVEVEEADRRVLAAERNADKAADDLARLEGLGDLVNRKEVDDARLAADQATDELELARFAARSAQIERELAVIAIERAEVAAERAATDLEYTEIRSPIRGVVAERNVDVGELSSMNEPLFVVVDVDHLLLDLRIPQDHLDRLAPGQPVAVRAVTGPKADFTGRVRVVNPVLEETTGTIQVLADLDPAPGLVPGLFCEARIVTAAREEALLVSKRAVLYEDDQPVLFAVEADGSARRVEFLAGATTPTEVEVLSRRDGSPLPLDLRVIVVGQENLKDGAPVRIVEEAF